MFRAWGRVGTTIGGNKVESFMSKATAVHAFCELYADKTGNDWEDRANFTKVTVLYTLIFDYNSKSNVYNNYNWGEMLC